LTNEIKMKNSNSKFFYISFIPLTIIITTVLKSSKLFQFFSESNFETFPLGLLIFFGINLILLATPFGITTQNNFRFVQITLYFFCLLVSHKIPNFLNTPFRENLISKNLEFISMVGNFIFIFFKIVLFIDICLNLNEFFVKNLPKDENSFSSKFTVYTILFGLFFTYIIGIYIIISLIVQYLILIEG
jgi:hypothetical protein